MLVAQPLHPATETARGLVYAAGIIALVFGAKSKTLTWMIVGFVVGDSYPAYCC